LIFRLEHCIICKNTKFNTISSRVRDSLKHQVVQCNKCKHKQLHPIPTSHEEKKFYDLDRQSKNIKDISNMTEVQTKMLEDTVRRSKLVKKLVKKGRILEIGSGHGFFLEMMEKQGYKMTGIEISREKRKIARQITRCQVLNVDINNEIPHFKPFDAIVMFHVIEHIIDPNNFLKNIRNFLKSKGKIIIEVPNSDDFQIKLNQSYNRFYWQRAHISYFTPSVLKSLLKKIGFNNIKIQGIQRYSIENMFNWKIKGKPQLKKPTYNLPKEYFFLEKFYKKNLEKNLKCDTLIAICTK